MPQIDLQQRQAILDHPDAQDCTVYRSDERDPDAEEQDLGDAKVLFAGKFEAPVEWDAREREEYFGDDDPEAFVVAYIACEAKPASKHFFEPEVGDYVAAMPTFGEVVMFYVHDVIEAERGRALVLIRDDED